MLHRYYAPSFFNTKNRLHHQTFAMSKKTNQSFRLNLTFKFEIMKKLSFLFIATFISIASFAQRPPVLRDTSTPIIEPLKLSGPRVGIIGVLEADYSRLYEISNYFSEDNPVHPVLSTFGWQFETQFFAAPNGTAGLIEFIPLVSGFEQGLFIPSLNMIFGLRTAEGMEVGFGPGISILGTGIIAAAGYNFRSEYLNIPVNLAYVQGRESQRVVLTVGFNLRRM